MALASLGNTVCRLRQLAAGRLDPELDDGQLLHAFAARNDQAAFAALVRRHGPLVFGVCRNVLRHEQDAEDAFQATFLTLARKAGSIRSGNALPGWLHGVAFRVALRARRSASRRRTREAQAQPAPLTAAWDVAWREVQAVLNEEVQRLPERYRVVFILCCLEGHGQREASRRLGLKEGTISSRLAEARRRLRERLTRRGLALSSVLTACSLSRETAAARALALLPSTVRAAGPRAAVSAGVTSLLRSSVAARGKLAAALLLAVSLAAVCTGMAARSQPAPPPPAPPALTPREPKPTPPEPAIVEKDDKVFINGRVLGPDGKPFARAKVYLGYAAPVGGKHRVRAVSGRDGRFRFSYSRSEDTNEEWITARGNYWRMFDVMAVAPGHGPTSVWIPDLKGALALRLVKETAIRGRVLDLQGRPVPGASVRVLDYRWAMLHSPVTTDKDGRFVVTGVGRDGTAELHVSGPAIEIKRVTVSTKPPVNAEVIVGPTKVIEGVVLARNTGKPLAGVVVHGKDRFDALNIDPNGPKAVTDTRGHYRLVGLTKTKKYEVIAEPPPRLGYLLAAQFVGDTEGLKPLTANFTLRRGIPVRLRLLDKQTRKPVRCTAQYTLARTNPLWGEAVSPYNPGFVLPPRVWFPSHCTNKDGVIEFVAYPGHGAVFVWKSIGGADYPNARLDPADEKKGYHPLSKGEPNNGFLTMAVAYRVLDTNNTDKRLTFDIVLTSMKPGK
jgi:RNA polymerase sigma factor (sigma-70 family)